MLSSIRAAAFISLIGIVANAATIPYGNGTTRASNTTIPAITIPSAYTLSTVAPTATLPPAYTPSGSTTKTACAVVASSVAEASASAAAEAKKNPTFTDTGAYTIPIQVAIDCLVSVPLYKDTTVAFLEELAKYVQFQTTLSYLKDPPAGSDQVPVDLIGALADLAEAVKNDTVTGEYEFELAIFKLINSAHEGHLAVHFPFSSKVEWVAPFSVVSLSIDGLLAPEIFALPDVVNAQTDSSFIPSAIVLINGQNSTEYIEELAFYLNAQSPDARYNSYFATINPSTYTPGFFKTPLIFPGSLSFTVTFANGTTAEYAYSAITAYSTWKDYVSPEQLYETLVLAPTSTAAAPSAAATDSPIATTGSLIATTDSGPSTPTETPTLVVFNQPFIDTPEVNPYVSDINNLIGGYFLNDSLRTAVINVAGFEATNDSAPLQGPSFQAAVSVFLAEALVQGSQKLVIDVRGNGGGLIELGYDFYKQLFPTSIPYSGTRLRANQAAIIYTNALSQAVNLTEIDQYIFDLGYGDGSNLTSPLDEKVFSVANGNDYVPAVPLDINGNHFATTEDFIGPFTTYGDNFTAILTRDLSDPLTFGDPTFTVTGYRARSNLTALPQPFAPENIVLLTDGNCASTCTIFSEFLRTEQNIMTVVMGGRPNGQDSAAIGGTRGAAITPFSRLLGLTQELYEFDPPSTKEQVAAYEAVLPNALPLTLTAGSCNARDNIRKSDPTQTPLQFFLEPADCRLYYTYTTYLSSVELWTYVTNQAWGGTPYAGCAVGGLRPGLEPGSVDDVPSDPKSVTDWILNGFNSIGAIF